MKKKKRLIRAKALSRRTDPWSSREVEDVNEDIDLQEAIIKWLRMSGYRVCEQVCPYASDFEITQAMLPTFPEVYEGSIRRQVRLIRGRKKAPIEAVDKTEHYHVNPATNRRSQCYRVRVKVLRRGVYKLL